MYRPFTCGFFGARGAQQTYGWGIGIANGTVLGKYRFGSFFRRLVGIGATLWVGNSFGAIWVNFIASVIGFNGLFTLCGLGRLFSGLLAYNDQQSFNGVGTILQFVVTMGTPCLGTSTAYFVCFFRVATIVWGLATSEGV